MNVKMIELSIREFYLFKQLASFIFEYQIGFGIVTVTANKQIAKAKGDSATKVINAMGEAEAVRKIQQALTPTYVEYIKATRWNGVQPTTIVGGGASTILSLK